MKKLFAMFLALTMTFQLITPAWADAAAEEPEEVTEETEVVEEETQEETTEATEEELPEETTEVPMESEEAPTEETVPETTDAEETQPETVEETVGMLAEGVIDSGSCGGALTWVLTSDGTLTISGDGAMENFDEVYGEKGERISTTTPWNIYGEEIKKVLIISGVSSIGDRAFTNCNHLESIDIPESITSIGWGAFDGCSSLMSVTIPDGVTSIKSCAFKECSSLTDVTIPKGITSVEYQTFFGCSGLTNVVIPEGVTDIGNAAFRGCSGLTSVTLPEDTTGIGWEAFYDCSSLTNAVIPEGVTFIGFGAFSGCSCLTSIAIPSSVTNIKWEAFSGCSSLTSVTIPKGVPSIEWSTFEGCSSLISLEISEGVTSIGDSAFRDCSSLVSVIVPEGVTNIGERAFDGCSDMIRVTIPESVTSIGDAAFYGCSSLTSIKLPKGMTSISKGIFRECSSLENVTVPENVVSIGDEAFSGCERLTNVVIPKDVTNIGSFAFAGCSSFTSIMIPEGVTSIENYTFRNCSGLIDVTITKGVTSIGEWAFSGCSNLTSIMIPEGVTNIGWEAFSECSSLISMTIPESVTNIGPGAFFACDKLGSIVIPEGMVSIKESTFGGCSGLTSVTIPKSVTSIHENAFDGCKKLKDVYYGGTKTDWSQIKIAGNNTIPRTATIHYQSQIGTEIRPTGLTELDGGDTQNLILWSLMQDQKIPAAWSLYEGDEAYATITSNGTLTAKAVAEPVEITVIAEPTNGEPRATKTIRINPKATALLLMLDGEPLGENLDVDMYDRETLTLTAIKNTMEEAQGIRWSTSKKDVAQVDANGVVTLLKPGTAIIQATDDGKLIGKVTLNVTYTDKSPRLEVTTLNLNTALSGGVTVDFLEAYGNGVEALQWDDERFVFEYQENQLTVSAKNPLKNGTYPVTLRVTCADEREYTYPLTIKVTNTLPKPTVKQTAKLNLFYKNSTAPLTVTVPGQTVENVELTDTEDFTLEPSEDGWEIVYMTEDPKPDTKGTLNIYLEGYREPAEVALTVGTISTVPAVKLSAAFSTINSAFDLTTRVILLDKSGKPLELENPSVDCDNADVSIDGNLVTITLDAPKATTVTMYLQDSTWAQPIKLTHKVTVSNKKPTLKPAGNLTLNSLFTARTAETAMVLSQSNLSLETVDFVSTAKEGSAAWTEAQKLELSYDMGYATAKIRDGENAPKAGTYSFKCTGILENEETIPGGTLKVTVSAAAPKVKLSATSVMLNKFLAGKEQGTVTATAPNGYQVVDFEGMPEGMTFDEDTGILSVELRSNSDNGGSYDLYPVVRDVETGEEVTLSTKLSFKVQAYNSQKLSVSLSAKGKLDTQTDGEIAYTVTKLTNCLGTVEDVVLEGQDKDLFRAEMDVVNSKPTVHLTLVDGVTYATNKAYKIQFRFYACGREILSPVQTVKVTQTALKVTVPKTVTYYQAQKSPLRVVLTANVPMDKVTMNSKTAKEFREAVGDMTQDGNRLEFEIANPGALTAGKSYSVVLDATPCSNASNVPPVTIKLTVKVQK